MWHTKATLIMCFITSKEKIHYVLSLPSENQQLNTQRVTLWLHNQYRPRSPGQVQLYILRSGHISIAGERLC